jgi:hypothetical protein
MRTILYILLILTNVPFAPAAEYDTLLSSLKIEIREVSPSGSINVDVTNASKEPVKIWSESGSYGAARWRVLRIRKGQLETFFQHPNQNFTRNSVYPVEIAVGAHIQEKLDVNGGNWCGFGQCTWFNRRGIAGQQVGFEPGDIIVVTYDVPRTDLAVKAGVWYGVAGASKTVQ